MSLTIVAFGCAVRVGGEFDHDGKRGFVLLACTPSPCLLTRRAARDVARSLVQFAERVRPVASPKRGKAPKAVVRDTARMIKTMTNNGGNHA